MEAKDFYVNATKKLIIEVDGKTYARHAIQIPFVNVGDDYDALVRQYVVPVWQPGDIVSVSEKIVSLCQKRVVYAEDVKPGLLARILCRFVVQTSAGPGAGVPYKMQFAIQQCGGPQDPVGGLPGGRGQAPGDPRHLLQDRRGRGLRPGRLLRPRHRGVRRDGHPHPRRPGRGLRQGAPGDGGGVHDRGRQRPGPGDPGQVLRPEGLAGREARRAHRGTTPPGRSGSSPPSS